jgi:hypothetical protein
MRHRARRGQAHRPGRRVEDGLSRDVDVDGPGSARRREEVTRSTRVAVEARPEARAEREVAIEDVPTGLEAIGVGAGQLRLRAPVLVCFT